MKFKKEYIILLFLIIALSSYIIFQSNNKTNYTLPQIEVIKKNDVSKVVIKKVGQQVDLEKVGDGWIILPEKYPADKKKVENMLDKAGDITLTALASESKNYEVYQLDDESRIEVELFNEGKRLRKIYIGKPVSSSRHTFVQISGDYRVYHAEGNLNNVFNKTMNDLRDKKTLDVNEVITKVTLIKDKSELKLVKKAVEPKVKKSDGIKKKKGKTETRYRWQTADGKDVQESEVTEVVDMMKDFECDGFINDKKKKDFKKPSYKVILSGADDYSISFFSERDGKYVAISSQSDYPFLVSEWRAKRIMKDFDEILGKEKSKK